MSLPAQENPSSCYTAFAQQRVIVSGTPEELVPALIAARALDDSLFPVVFKDATGERIELDWRDDISSMLGKLRQQESGSSLTENIDIATRTGPGRPKLGVIAREVTLLPRHWDWLASQPGGASVALRKLVEAARKANTALDQARQSLEAAHRFMSFMGSDQPGFEEASRAMFAADFAQARRKIRNWPEDLRRYAEALMLKAEQDALAAREDN